MHWYFVGRRDEILPAAAEDWEFGATVPDDWTLTRSAPALGRGSDGRWTSYAANSPRPYHDPVTLENRGLLIEPERTQLVFNSRQPQYTAARATSTYDATVQTPFGLGALKLTPTTELNSHGFDFYFTSPRASTIPDGSTVSVQLTFKMVGAYTRMIFFVLNRANAYRSVVVNTEGNGSVISSSVIDAVIERDTDGFFTLKITADLSTGATTPAFNASFALDDSGARVFSADGTSHLFVAYLGAEVGTETTSPIVSSGVTTVRPADVLTTTPSWLRAGARSFGMQYTPLSRDTQVILGSIGQDSLTLRTSPTTVSYVGFIGSENVVSLTANAPAPGVERTTVLTAGYDDFLLAQDGAALGTDKDGMPPTRFDQLRIGSQGNGSAGGPMLLKRLKYWTSSLDNDAVKAFSKDITQPGTAPDLPVLSIQPARTVTPTENLLTLTVTLDGEAAGATVKYRTVDGTAVAGEDYVGSAGTLLFTVGQRAADVVIALPARGTDADKAFSVELLAPSGATIAVSTCLVTLQRVIPTGPVATTQTTFGATLPLEWTLTRTTAARTRNSAGIWTSVAANGHRHHYESPGISGLLVEPVAAEQRLYDSVDPGWGATASTKTADTTTQVATGTRSLRWREDATTAEHKLTLTLGTTAADMPTGEFTTWLLVRPVNRQYLRLRIRGIDNVVKMVRFNLTGAGSVVFQDSGIIVYCRQDPFFPEWYQIGMDRPQATSAGVSATVELVTEDAAGTTSIAGSTDSGFDLAHVQLEPGAGMTSPIIVQGASAKTVRDRDIIKAAGSWFQTANYSLGIRYVRLRSQPNIQLLAQIKDTSLSGSTDDNSILVENGVVRGRVRIGGTALTAIEVAAPNVPGVVSTVLMVVDSAARISLFSDTVKAGELVVGTGGVAAPKVPAVLRLGATEPSGLNPASFLIQAVYRWDTPLQDSDALLFSGNLAYAPEPTGPVPQPVVAIPSTLSVTEGSTVPVVLTKSGVGACSVVCRTKAATATLTTDYAGFNNVVTFAANETTKSINLATVADTISDSGETLSVVLETPVDCTLGNAICTVTIVEGATVSVPATFSVSEGQAASIALTKVGAGACSVSVKTAVPMITSTTSAPAADITVNPIAVEIIDTFAKFVPTRTLWVSPTGSDTTGTGTQAAPYRQVNKAMTEATPGTAIKVRAGTYSGITAAPDGTKTAPITVECVDTQHSAIIEGPTGNAAIEMVGFSWIMIKNFSIVW